MEPLNTNRKVADLLKQHPQTYEILQKYGCPDMRKGFFSFMARLMSLRNAAWIHRIPIDKFIADLERAIQNKGKYDG